MTATTTRPAPPTFTRGPGVHTRGPRWTADCGCTIEGRFVGQRDCTAMDLDKATGSQLGQHVARLRAHLPKEN
jgi:hypothetical protein